MSGLRNYTKVLKDVRMNQPVYLIRYGQRVFTIVDMNELNRLKAIFQLLPFALFRNLFNNTAKST